MTEQQFTAHLKQNEHRLIIFGAGYFGERIAKTCKLNDILPVCVCDNNPQRIGQTLEGIPVISFDEVQNKYENPIFILSPYESIHQTEIISQVETVNFKEMQYYNLAYFFDHIEKVYLNNLFEKIELNEYKMKKYETIYTDYTYTPFLIMDITYLCTLNCRDCSHFVPYHKNPAHFKKEDLFTYIDRIDELFDTIGVLALLGGEPFLHPDLFEIIQYAQTKDSIKTVRISSNATILPSKDNFINLDRDKVHFTLSEYTNLSKHLDMLGKQLSEMDFDWSIYEPTRWLPVTDICFRNKTVKEMEESYAACCAEKCLYTHIMDGKMLPCVMANAGGYVAKGLPKEALQMIDLMDQSKTLSELQAEIRQFKYGITYYEACNWCPVIKDVESIYVEPAIQVKGKLSLANTYEN